MMQKPPGESFGYSASMACQVDSYMSPSSRITDRASIGAAGKVSLNQPYEEPHPVVEQAVALEVVPHLAGPDAETGAGVQVVTAVGGVQRLVGRRQTLERVGDPDDAASCRLVPPGWPS